VRRRARLSLAFAAVALTALACVGAAWGKPPVWTLRGPAGTVVLFGSVHILPGGLDWRPAALDEVLSHATDIWFELPISQVTDQRAVSLTIRRGRLAPGDSLWLRLTPARRAALEAAAAAVGVRPEAMASMRPWLADLTLSLAADARAGGSANDGVEAALQSDAPPTARRHAFETVEQQMGFLTGGSADEQLASLDETMREVTDDPGLYDRTVKEWMAGDLAGLRRDDLDVLKATSPEAYQRLIARRNRRWVRVIETLARNRGVTVVVVGAGHLIGPDGVPALLRADGFKVDGP
jgi:uncharacterized protein YbaP (TraB family)